MTSNPIQTCIIKPTNKYNHPCTISTISLTAWDPVSLAVHIPNHRFYQRPAHLSPEDVVTKLKASLAEALELYPPVAGTARVDEKGEAYIAVDGEGAIFQSEVKDTPFEGDSDDFNPRPVLVLPSPSHGLAVRVTQFSCGTIAVASSMHHWLTDLRGFLDFLGVWATLTRGEPVDLQTIPRDWSHTPGRFFPTKQDGQRPVPLKGYRVLAASSTEFSFAPSEAQAWKITESSLATLKEDFTPKNSSDWISSGDALTALLWGVITRARESAKVPHKGGFGRSTEDSGEETIATAADGRERSPNKNMMGGQFFGNFNNLFMTTVPRVDLVSTDLSAASRVSLALRKSLNTQLSLEAIVDRIHFLEFPEYASKIVWEADIAFTNWSHSDLQGRDMDFGWGQPFAATAGGGAVPGGFGRVIWQRNTKEIHVLISVEKEGASHMKADPLLTKYATLCKVY